MFEGKLGKMQMQDGALGFEGLDEFHHVFDTVRVRMAEYDVLVSFSMAAPPSPEWLNHFDARFQSLAQTWGAEVTKNNDIIFPMSFVELARKFAATVCGKYDRSWSINAKGEMDFPNEILNQIAKLRDSQ